MAEQNMLNRNIDNGDKLRKSALLIGADVMTAAHVDRHFEDGSINGAKINLGTINIEDLGTAETNTTRFLNPDGVGGLAWGALPNVETLSTAETVTTRVLNPDGVGGLAWGALPNVETLSTAATNTSYALKPDGAGGLVFGAVGGGGAIDYDGTFTNSLVSTNGSVGGADSIAIGRLSTATNTSPVNPNSYYVALSFGLDNQVAAYYTHGIAVGANITGDNGVIGIGSNITMPAGGIGIGYNINEPGFANIVIREGGTVQNAGSNKVQIGWQLNEVGVNPGRSVAIGHSTQIDYKGVAVGFGAQAAYNNEATGVGYQAQAKGLRSVAIGSQAYSRLNATGAVAVGYDATVTGTALYGIAIGHKSQIGNNHTRSVAVGADVVTTAANQVNLGVSNTNKIVFDTWTAGAAASKPSTHQLPILIGATRFYILLSNV